MHKSLFGVVFAGGASKRMGGDKALMRWPALARSGHGTSPGAGASDPSASMSLLERSARCLQAFCSHVEIAAGAVNGRASLGNPGWAAFPDAYPAVASSAEKPGGPGPLGGLVAALERAEFLGMAGTAVLACDMPLVEAVDFDPLRERLEAGADVAMWTVEGPEGVWMDQPLVAVYGGGVHVAARAALESGARRLVAISEFCAAEGRHLRVDRVRATENSSRRLVNVNTPSDYHGAVADYLRHQPRHRGPWPELRDGPHHEP